MTLQTTGIVADNDPGAQLYFRELFANSPAFPFDAGDDEFRAICVPAVDAIVLVDADRELEYPLTLTIHDPESYRYHIEPDPETMPEQTHPEDDDPRGETL